MTKIRVCVIGAGAAGLCAGRNLSDRKDLFDFTIFEQTTGVGGTWVYAEKSGSDENNLPIHSSMYESLRTNIPKEIMGFPDFEFPQTGPSFTPHSEVLRYLEDYAKHYNLHQFIKFHYHVKNIRPETTNEGQRIWKVLTTDIDNNIEEKYEFDSVMICNGHYSVPNIPKIPGIENFQGSIIHSHSYRKPDPYENKNIVILGAASSGTDIGLEIATVGRQIYLSHNLPQKISCQLPVNVVQVPGIKQAHENGFTFQDDSFVKADGLVYCTGYKFDFPFLTEECNVKIDEHRITPLYKHIIHQDFPELCFIGLPFTVIPFPMFHFQIQYFLKALDKSMILPSREEMIEETENDFNRRINEMHMPPKYAHKMGALQWDYFSELGNEAGFETLAPVVRKIYERVEGQRKVNLMNYKQEEYKLLGKEDYMQMMPKTI